MTHRKRAFPSIRFGFACLAAIISFSQNANALTAEQCRKLAPSVAALQQGMQGALQAQESLTPLADQRTLDFSNMKEEALAMDATNRDLVKSLKAFIIAIQDYSYQIQRCAR